MNKTLLFAIVLGFASSSVACGSTQAAHASATTPVQVNAADWTPPGEQQMTLPDAPVAVARREEASASPLRPTVFSEGKKGSLVTLATKRAN